MTCLALLLKESQRYMIAFVSNSVGYLFKKENRAKLNNNKMELQFTKNADTNYWSADAVVTNDFNLHIELEGYGEGHIFATTVEGRKKVCASSFHTGGDGLYEQDYDSKVFPKYLTIVVNKPVIKGYITVVSD